MLNILHVISDTNIGGAGTHLVSVVNSLNKKNFNVFVACPKDAQIINLIDSSVNIVEVSSMKGDTSFNFRCISELCSIIKKHKINIVHTHANLSGRIAAKLCRRKIIFTRHTPGIVYRKNSPKWILNKYINNFLTDRVIAVSEYIKSQLIDYGFPDKKISVVYNGINFSTFEGNIDINKAKNIYGITDEIVLIIVARLEEIKGHKYLLKAFHKLIREDYNLKLIIVGSGSKEHEIIEFVKAHSIEKNVVLTGTIKDIKHVLSISDIVLLPSLIEALGLALIEGMYMSKPCIASNVDGIPEVVNDGKSGILVTPKSVDELKDAIIRLYNDKELRLKMGQEGHKIVVEKFGIDKMIKELENVYYNI